MERGEYTFLWERPDWPAWRYRLDALAEPLARASHAQGHLLGRLRDAGRPLRDQASLIASTEDAIRTSLIEGERLEAASVRSSIARKLGVDIGALAPLDRQVEGVVDLVLDATRQSHAPVTAARLFGWHAGLFPTGHAGLAPIRTGVWRDDARGAMQVVSGPVGRMRVHDEAPPAERLPAEMDRFLDWINGAPQEPPLIRAGIGHLWFVTLHPFEDGNGRIARAIGDLLLARADGSSQRFYSLSAQIQREWKDYYDLLERTQRGGLDITEWLAWFLGILARAVLQAEAGIDEVLARDRFWRHWSGLPLNPRQHQMLTRLLEGFEGKLTSTKWAALTRCSADTALRDLNGLVARGVLRRLEGGGRSTAYALSPWPG